MAAMTATKLFAAIGLVVGLLKLGYDISPEPSTPYPLSWAQREICAESPAAREACCVRHDKNSCYAAIKEYVRAASKQ